ncbi:MAG: tripartite tricarboxylate transporter TctB family protein [Desulfobacteraceae bacterium]|nr:MAG: tripartite tricarboxylate transporter TctB family protein [Desulfobacteraceae bacterium]
MKKGEIVFFGCCVAFFGFMLVAAMGLMAEGRPGEIGSGTWPLLALGASAVLSVILLTASINKSRRAAAPAAEATPEARADLRRQRTTVTLSSVCFLVYMIAVPYVGFILATFLFIPAFALALGERRKTVLFIAPVVLTVIIVGVFAKFITIPFPKGVGVFAEFSRLFY